MFRCFGCVGYCHILSLLSTYARWRSIKLGLGPRRGAASLSFETPRGVETAEVSLILPSLANEVASGELRDRWVHLPNLGEGCFLLFVLKKRSQGSKQWVLWQCWRCASHGLGRKQDFLSQIHIFLGYFNGFLQCNSQAVSKLINTTRLSTKGLAPWRSAVFVSAIPPPPWRLLQAFPLRALLPRSPPK